MILNSQGERLIARKTFLSLAQEGVGLIFGYIGLKLAALYLGDEAIGMMAYGFGIIGLLSIIANLGFQGAHIKRVSEGKNLGRCIGTFLTIKIILILCMIGATLGWIYFWTEILREPLVDTSKLILMIALVYYIVQHLIFIPVTTFNAKVQTARTQMGQVVQHPFKLGAIIMVVSAATGFQLKVISDISGTAEALSVAYYLVPSIAMLIAVYAIFFYFKYPIKAPTRKYLKSYSKFALPVFLITVSVIIVKHTDKVIIGFFYGPEEVGEYFGVQRISEFAIMLSWALALILFPTFSEMVKKKDLGAARKLMIAAERYIAMAILPVCIVLLLFAYPTIHIMLSDDWIPAAYALSFLAIFVFFISMNRIRTALLQGMDKPGYTARVALVICICNIVLNLLLVPEWNTYSIPLFIGTRTGAMAFIPTNGVNGAAIATMIAYFVGFLQIRYYTKKFMPGLTFFNPHMRRQLAAALFAASLLLLISLIFFPAFPDWRWYHLVMISGLSLAFFYGALRIFGEFTDRDIKFLRSILNPKEMGRYIKSELSK
jgi:O-antigen/teichoic acid export membrane protein